MDRVRLAVTTSSLWRAIRLVGAGLLLGALALALVTAGRASATTGCGTLSSGTSMYINCVVPSASAPYTSFNDGDPIDLSMGPNSVFSSSPGVPGASIDAVECEYNNGAGGLGDPPNSNFCSSQTLPGDFPYTTHSDGSFDYADDNNGDTATMFALPDATFPTATITCSTTSPCVWYVGENFNDFTAPHVFSNPFVVTGSTPPTTTMPTTTTTSTPTTSTTTSTTSSTTTTTNPASTTTTSSTTSTTTSSSTTTTNPYGSSTTTSSTVAGVTTTSPSTGSGGSDSGSSSGSGSDGGATTSASSVQLAFTGASPLIVWMLGVGMLFVIAGTVGRLTIAKPAD